VDRGGIMLEAATCDRHGAPPNRTSVVGEITYVNQCNADCRVGSCRNCTSRSTYATEDVEASRRNWGTGSAHSVCETV